MNIASHDINHSNCHDLPRFSKVNWTNRGKDWIWKSYDTIHLYEELSTINPVFLELIEKMENWGEDWIWYVKIYSTRWINCQNLFHFLRISTFNESLPSGEVNNFSRYTVESPAQSLGIIRQISLSLRRLFCWKRECSLPYKISVYQSASFGVMFHHCDVLIVEKGLHIPHTLGI